MGSLKKYIPMAVVALVVMGVVSVFPQVNIFAKALAYVKPKKAA